MLRDVSQRFRHPDGRINYSALSRHTGYDRKTLRKYLARNILPKSKHRRPKPSKLDDYKEAIQQRLSDYPEISAARIYRELHERGYSGESLLSGTISALSDPTKKFLQCIDTRPNLVYKPRSTGEIVDESRSMGPPIVCIASPTFLGIPG